MTDRMLNERLDALICEADSAKFSAFAEALTCKDFRRACVILSDYTLPSITDENVFWHAFVFLCRCNAKAFLVTCLKAVRRLYLNGKLTFHSDILAEYAAERDGMLVAFWDGKSRGTASMIRIAEKAGLQIKTITY